MAAGRACRASTLRGPRTTRAEWLWSSKLATAGDCLPSSRPSTLSSNVAVASIRPTSFRTAKRRRIAGRHADPRSARGCRTVGGRFHRPRCRRHAFVEGGGQRAARRRRCGIERVRQVLGRHSLADPDSAGPLSCRYRGDFERAGLALATLSLSGRSLTKSIRTPHWWCWQTATDVSDTRSASRMTKAMLLRRFGASS